MSYHFILKTPLVSKKTSQVIAKNFRTGGRFIKPNARAVNSEDGLRMEFFSQVRSQGLRAPIEGRVCVGLTVAKGRSDLINLVETIFDAMQKVVVKNDRQIAFFSAAYSDSLPDGVSAYVSVYETGS